MSINHFIADELANRVMYLSKALYEAKKTISVLEEENQSLQDILDMLSTNDSCEEFYDEPIGSGN